MLGNEYHNRETVRENQEIPLRDSSGRLRGYVSRNGFLYDHKHTLLGYISQVGNVRDVKLRHIGHINIQQHDFPYEAGKCAFFLLKEKE